MKIINILIILFFIHATGNAQNLQSVHLVEKTGWILYWFGDAIWFEADLPLNVDNESFFASDSTYGNGLIINYLGNAKKFRALAGTYAVKVLTTNKATKKDEYSYSGAVRIIPVKAKLELRPDSGPFDIILMGFKRNKKEIKVVFSNLANYTVVEIDLLRPSDKKLKTNRKKKFARQKSK